MSTKQFQDEFVRLCMDAGLTSRQAHQQPADCALHIMGQPVIALPSKRARAVLSRYKLDSIYDLTGWTQADLKRLKGCGNVTKSELFLLRPHGAAPCWEDVQEVLLRGNKRKGVARGR